MEQLEQLKKMRDDAEVRLDVARAAIESSPDAKLSNSLSKLIDELETAFKSAEAIAVTEAPAEIEAVQAAPVVEAPETVTSEAAQVEDEEGLSLEESLEAELMSVEADAGKATAVQ